MSQKTILDHLDGYAAAGITSFVGAFVLWPLMRREGRRGLPKHQGSFGLVVTVSVLFTLAATVMQLGYGHTSVTNAGFLANTSAAAFDLAGLSADVGRGVSDGRRQLGRVDLWGCFGTDGGIGLCGLDVVFGSVCDALSPPDLYNRGPICTGLGAATYGLSGPSAIVAAWSEIIVLGAMSTGLTYCLNATAQHHITPACASVIISAGSVFGGLSTMIILG